MIDATTVPRVDRRREFVACVIAAVALVVLRSVVFLAYERFFDSDQAIVGLMAKHLSEFRVFPLFFYGQHYMLGVQAWVAVPFFWVGGPTMAMLRAPVEIFNLAVAVALLAIFVRLGMRPLLALVATLPFVTTSTAVSKELLSVLGASVEPFAYVLGLWFLRRRPVPFGVLLCVGFLHREFTIFALPALVFALWPSWRSWSPRRVAMGAAAFVAVWVTVDFLKRHVSAVGPSETPTAAASLLMQMRSLGGGVALTPGHYVARMRQVLLVALPDFFGASPYAMTDYGITSTLRVGSTVAGLAFAAAIIIAVVRLVWVRSTVDRDQSFFAYLFAIGVLTVLAYGTNENLEIGNQIQLRYLLFALLVPTALLGAFFQAENRALLRWTVVGLVAVWAGANTRDNIRLVNEFRVAPIPAYHRELADYLVAHRVKYAWGGYWDSYIVDFFSEERVIVASTEKVRIASYQRQVTEHDAEAVQLVRQPCDGGTPFEAWCLQGAPFAH